MGSGGIHLGADWIHSDIDMLNILNEEDWVKASRGGLFTHVFAEHVWEHLTAQQAEQTNAYVYRFLRPGGKFRLAVPDGYKPDPGYIEHVRPGGTGPGADDHKVLYTYKTLSEALKKVGFETNLLEWWDEAGQFHFCRWNSEGGMVRRSRRYDKRNEDGVLRYTSLIVDAVKK